MKIFHLAVPAFLLLSSLSHAGTKNPPALPVGIPSLKAQYRANAAAAGVLARIDSPTFRVRRLSDHVTVTIAGLVGGGVAGGATKFGGPVEFRDAIEQAKFKISITQNGELAKRLGAWTDIQKHRM